MMSPSAPTWSMCISAGCAGRSMIPLPRRSSSPFAAPAIACPPQHESEGDLYMEQRQRRHHRLPPYIPILASVRTRLALWYLGITACVLLAFGGNLYFTETSLTTDAGDAQLETPLNQDAQRLTAAYTAALLGGKSPATQQVTLAPDEI